MVRLVLIPYHRDRRSFYLLVTIQESTETSSTIAEDVAKARFVGCG